MRFSPYISRCALSLTALALCTLGGCSRSEPTAESTPASSPATAPSQVVAVSPAPATQPATQPIVSSLLINDMFKQFPGACLRLLQTDNHVTAILYSSDPPTAIDNDYHGNSYYLKMPLDDVKDVASINGAEWRFKSNSSDRSDSNDGIFLDGLRHQLQPMDVVVRFEGNGSGIRLRLAGEFMDYDNTALHQPGILTTVGGDLNADVDPSQKQ